MTKHTNPDKLLSVAVPAPDIASPFTSRITLADVRDCAVAATQGAAQRDLLSAFRFLTQRLSVDLNAVVATAASVRTIFETTLPARVDVSAKRLANIRSLVGKAVAQHGMHRGCVTRGGMIDPTWSSLLAQFEPAQYRSGLSRLARFASANDIMPDAVTSQTLVGFRAALEAESFVQHPNLLTKRTIALWNMAMRQVVGWPQAKLASPFVAEPDTLPMDAFPLSFGADVERWVARMSRPDPLDLDAPVKALRPATVKSYRMIFRRFASALVRRGVLRADEVTELAVFFDGGHFKAGLYHFLRPGSTRLAHQIATQLSHVARHYIRLDEERMAEVVRLRDHLDPKLPRVMGRRNRDRLEQFDDPDAVQRLLAFPQAEAERAKILRNPVRQAKSMELALAVALLIDKGLRIQNLRTIRLDKNLRRTGDTVFLTFEAAEVKNGVELEHALPSETVGLLDAFIATHRPLMPGHEGPYLFPAAGGGPRSDGALRHTIKAGMQRGAGLIMSPHLFRHAIAKIVVERDPSLYAAMSRHLGHKSMNTLLTSYVGVQTRNASRHLNRLLAAARANPKTEV